MPAVGDLPTPPPRPPRPALAALAAAAAVAAVVGLYLLLVAPFIFRGGLPRATDDEATYHRPTVEQFARQWPWPDVADYPSAATPGYYLVLAPVRRFVTADVRPLRLAGLAFSVGLVATLAGAVGRRAGFGLAVVLCLPFVCSLYVISSGARLLPDNAGWWGALAVVLIALRPRVDARTYLAGGAALLALVLVRQIHLWANTVLCLAAYLGPGADVGRRGDAGAAPGGADGHKWARLGWTALAVAPSVMVLLYFFHLWNGPLPPHPAVRQLNAGANPAVPAMALAVFGTVGVFYTGFLVPRWGAVRRAWRAVVGWALVGAAVAVVVPTDYDQAAGRWSGLWNVARALPTVAHRSPLIVALAALGGAILGAWWAALSRRDGWLFQAAWLTFTFAHAFTHEAFQRYYEPWALVLFALGASRLVSARGGDRHVRWAVAGPLLLAALLGAITFVSR